MPEKTTLFLSDVHLSAKDTPRTKLFCQTISKYKNYDIYILGDLFDAWLGDDTIGTWLEPVKQVFSSIIQAGNKINLMPGNHDFLIGNALHQYLGTNKIPDPYIITLKQQRILLTHGDKFCLNDASYQRIRPILQHKLTKKLFLTLPIATRKKLANNLQGRGQAKDIDLPIIIKELAKFDCQTAIFGHIHKQQTFNYNGKNIISLCAWDLEPELYIF